MMAARLWQVSRIRPHAAASRSLVAVASVLAVLLVVAVSPDAARGNVTGMFDSLRSPGEAGFVASHRGDSQGTPENTLPAFERAIASDSAFVETDIQLTSDEVPILMHDWTLDRTTNGSGPVWAMSYNDIIGLDAGTWYDPAFAGTRVPTLQQLLALLQPSTKSAILEFKGSWTVRQTQIVTDLLDEYGLANRVILASFDLMTLRALREAAPEVSRVIIARSVVGDPAVLAAACGAVAIVTSARFIQSDPGAVGRIHDAGLGALIYTLNDEAAWEQAISLGADGVITDRPETLSAWLAGG